MIYVNGCSFTWGEGGEFLPEGRDEFGGPKNGQRRVARIKDPYPSILAKDLNTELLNFSTSGKDNTTILKQMAIALNWRRLGKCKSSPDDIIIVQLTDNFRAATPKSTFALNFHINDLVSQLEDYDGQYIKIMMFSILKKLRGQGYADTVLNKTYRIHSDIAPEYKTREPYIGDWTETHQTFETAHYLRLIQLECKSMNIPLVIINYYTIPEKFNPDPTFQVIDTDDFLISNFTKSGMYEHLENEGFVKCNDNFHFQQDAHYYQADVIKNFIKNKVRLKANTERFTPYHVHDYT